MDGLTYYYIIVLDYDSYSKEFSLKGLFTPLTTSKAIHWIVLIGLIVFCNMFFNGFVWDDQVYILYNPEIHTFNIQNIVGESYFNSNGQYRPFVALYFTALYSLFSTHTFFYHVLQLLIHIVNTILVFVLFKKFIDKKISLLIALVFLIHPIQVESVSFIASSGNPLFFFFGMSALLLCMKKNVGVKQLVTIFGLLLLSLLTKETGFLFLFIILFYVLFLNKNSGRIFILGSVLTTAFYFLIRLTIGGTYFAYTPILTPFSQLSLNEKLINIPAIIVYYLKTIIFPVQFAINQKWIIKTVDFSSFYLPLIIVILFFSLLFALGYYLYKTNKRILTVYIFFFLWFSSGLALHLQIFPLDMTVADRWFYFPMVGLIGMVAIGIQSLRFSNKLKVIGLVIVITMLLVFSTRTIIRNMDWHTPIKLYSHDIKYNPNADLETNLAFEYGLLGNYSESLKHALSAVELSQSEMAYYNAGHAYEKLGNIQKAKEYYYNALTTNHYVPQKNKRVLNVYAKVIVMEILTDNFVDAKKLIKSSMQEYPDSVQLWLLLAICEYKLQNQDEAVLAAKNAELLYPGEWTQALSTMIEENQTMELSLGSFPIVWINQ